MTSNDKQSIEEENRARLQAECGLIGWNELVRHFARGVVIVVEPGLELIEVALCLARDDTAQLQVLLDNQRVSRASDDNARDWTQRQPQFLCVVVAPWVVVQEQVPSAQYH